MEKRNHFLKSIFVLIALICASVTASGQYISSPASCTTDEPQQVVLRSAKLSVPMAPQPGDVNADGMINITDVTELIDLLLSGSSTYLSNADANSDGSVNITDVTDLIDLLLSGSPTYSYAEALNDLNEIYRSMHTPGWSTTGNTHQCFGISAYNLMAEVMGDDMIMGYQGSGWFWFDAAYNVKERYMYYNWRSYDLWNAYYTWISSANYILEMAKSMTGSTSEQNYIIGQAYAIRAYSYFMLAQSFARTYKGHESEPCVPLYEGTTFNGSTGQPRATVAQIYAQIDADINQAVTLLNGTTQQVPDHIGYAVALGLKARIALVEEDWATAYNSAIAAIDASGKSILNVPNFMGLNDAHAGNVMWGADIPLDEVGMYASFFSHMSADVAYGERAPKKISKWLYNKMSSTDARRSWWYLDDWYNDHDDYIQKKFDFSNVQTWEGDYIYMRIEEMYLTAAEAACHNGLMAISRRYLNELMAKRDPYYSCNKTGTGLGTLTTEETGSLLEEILIQRRLELWGEDGRIYTIRRLRQGFERTEENGWPLSLTLPSRSLQDPESYPWVMTIPMSEFLFNTSTNINYDQNPIGDYPEDGNVSTGPQDISFVQAEYHATTAALTYGCEIQLTRSTIEGDYMCVVAIIDENGLTTQSKIAYFYDGSNTASVSVAFGNMELGKTYSRVLTLSPYDIAYGTTDGRITSTRVEVKCENANPAGQHISFESASQELVTQSSYEVLNVELTRRVADGEYRAIIIMEDAPENITIYPNYVIFNDGELTANFEVSFWDITATSTYSCVLKLSDADAATAIPGEPQITSTTLTVKGSMADEGWIDAGTCTFTDYTWEEGYSATNIPILKKEGTNIYTIISPLASVYPSYYSDGQGDVSNWMFTLNDDGTITPVEGTWDLNYWGYYGYYSSTTYPDNCYVNKDGNTYEVNFLLQSGNDLNMGGRFTFTWDR